ncbi:molybdopterin converting factor subunit 1 [Sphingomonas sp. CGMCC 1.13654]|uniref:Molybdopterin converting factor subunit 1 n=1 Tax=Sphingomonas chungangi TaxID=2683589 RepID=A0A838LBB6_9SPHN|nr:molybdopterin converting factor subunit 1 [Sphingomonas chungangi]MBA2936142.1 molybdopterin converting factor subunit 1 [Sphingomonas chungangi]MVW55528.1 molybdopterin converting factor subunit 1 [Sphingomonas chungangi]
MVQLLYFAWVRERIGRDGEAVDVPAGVVDVAGLVDWLAARGGGYAEAFAEPARLRAAVDQTFAPLDAPIAGASEIALFPPVTGG